MTRTERISLLERVRTSWCKRHRPESESTDWGQSLSFYGLLRSLDVKDDLYVRSFLKQWVYFHLNEGVNVNYFCGSWSFALLYPEVERNFPEVQLQLKNTAGRIYDTIRNKALRNGNGILLHNIDLPNIYIDTVYFSAVLLAKLGPYLESDWKEDALDQIRKHLSILRDGDCYLYIHCQENLSGRRSEGAWARGNGWVMMACAELLSVLRPSSKEQKEILNEIFLPMVETLSKLQTKNGLWRTILDDKDAYEETSASAMYLFALARTKRLGLLPKKYHSLVGSTENGLTKFIDKHGRFNGVSEGTWPGTKAYYKSLEQGEWWWGTGAYLLALSELAAS